jgi:hypothetical protein
MARVITGILERVDRDQQAVLVGTVLLRVSRTELLRGLEEGMSVTVRCEHSGEQTWATAVTPTREPRPSTEPGDECKGFGHPNE